MIISGNNEEKNTRTGEDDQTGEQKLAKILSTFSLIEVSSVWDPEQDNFPFKTHIVNSFDCCLT